MAEEEVDVEKVQAFAVCCVCGFVNARFSNLISVCTQTQKGALKASNISTFARQRFRFIGSMI